MNTFEVDIALKDMEYPLSFHISLYKDDTNELIKIFNIFYYKGLDQLINKLNNIVKERENKNIPYKLVDYLDARNGDKHGLGAIYGTVYIDIAKKICDELIINKAKNVIYSKELLQNDIKENLAHYFNIEVKNIQLYSDTLMKHFIKEYMFPFNTDRIKFPSIDENFTRNFNNLINLIKSITLIKIDNKFYIRRNIKENDLPWRVLYNMAFNFNMKTVYNAMYYEIKNKNLFENTIDNLLARYNYNVLDIDCIGELQYYLEGNHFISLDEN